MSFIEVQVSGGQGIIPATYKTIVLKPNIVNDKNMLTQAMFAQTDTKYVIKYDYIIDDDIVTESVQVLSSNVSQCVNPAYAEALTAYNEAHGAWIDADNAYTNDPNNTTLAAKNAAYAAYITAQTALYNTPQYYYYAAKAIRLHKGQNIIIPDTCVLLNRSRNALIDFEIAPVDSIVYIGSLIPETYEYTIQDAIKIPARSLLEFDGGSISNGALVGQDTLFINVGDVDIWGENLTRLGTWREKQGGGTSADQVQADWDESDEDSKAYIRNKPTIPQGVIVDDEFSEDSENPVQNKAITNTLDKAGIVNREYDPSYNSGLGRKILTLKNESNILTQDDFDKENCIYVITYDFDLGGEIITIPQGCVLKFDGGSVKNGKLISNNTYISGKINKDDSLYGAYKTVNEEYITLHNQILKPFRFDRVLSEDKKSIGGYRAASLCSDNNYFYVLYNKSDDSDCIVCIYDKNYCKKGETSIGASHGNSSCIMNGMLYLTSGGLKYIDAITLVNNAINNAPTSLLQQTLPEEITRVQSIAFDNDAQEFYIDNGNNTLFTLDTNFNVLNTSTSPRYIADLYVQSKGISGRYYQNEFVITKGIAVVVGGLRDDIGGDPFKGYITLVDIFSNKVFFNQPIDLGHIYSNEVEGITFDNDKIYLNCIDQRDSVSASEIVKCYFDTESFYLTNYKCFADNNYIGISYGFKANPFKNLAEVVSYISGLTSYSRISLAKSETPYSGILNLFDVDTIVNSYISSLSPNSDYAIINSNFALRNSKVAFEGIKFQDCTIAISGGNYTFTNCVFDNSKISIADSCYIEIYGCTITQTDYQFISHKDNGRRKFVALDIQSSIINVLGLFNSSHLSVLMRDNTIESETLFYVGKKTNTIFHSSVILMNTITTNALLSGNACSLWRECVNDEDEWSSLYSFVTNLSSFREHIFDIDIRNDCSTSMIPKGECYFNSDKKLVYKNIPNVPSTYRPTICEAGTCFFDTTLGKPIYWNGSSWIDSFGNHLTWSIKYVLYDVTASNMAQPVSGEQYTTIITPNEGFILPSTIILKIDGIIRVAGTDYTYDQTTGEIVILGIGGTGGVTGDVRIGVAGVAQGAELSE